ncbi:cell division and transport-associated protein TolA [Nitrosospira sp. Nsp2]|uniref:cell envelope integrity protein TolA n=1 Tax=Nitrosospira sp. Nsp2 TaxID=136548 RepID=UPI000D48D81D|nr:cell envelope integrity protein TolA [Nitrosospira sp. Nsp2]PTR14166.1 cell division and transport-associated protein TolA [Nitrosospira sp. Nsp2]
MTGIALRNSTHLEPGRLRAGVLAVLVHIVFFAFMIFGLNWKTFPPEGMAVELWSSLPPPPLPVQPEVKAPPPPPSPPPPQEAKPFPPPPKPEVPPPAKPDIAIKEKIEKPKPEKKPVEQKQQSKKEQKELKEQAEKEKAKELKEKEQKEREKEQKEKEQKTRIAAEVERLQREQEANDKLQQLAAAQSRLADEMAEYKAKIMAKIRRNIVMPPDLPGNPAVEFDVTLLPGGDILDVKMRRTSGYPAFDSAVERGIFMSKPLPLPPDPALFSKFRNLNVKVHYHE